MTLGSNIKKIRKEANLSQEAFAEMFLVSRQTISNWETSKSYPDLETIIKISDSFHVSLDILLKEDLIMVKTFDNEIKSTKRYAKVLTIMAVVIALIIGSFAIYSCVYFSTKNKLEKNFAEQLEENHFYEDIDGGYSMDYAEGIVYSVPNQSMPSLLEFCLNFHAAFVYCDAYFEDTYVRIMWSGYDNYHAEAFSQKDDGTLEEVIGKIDFADKEDMKKLNDELGVSEKVISELMKKGNELYKDFY